MDDSAKKVIVIPPINAKENVKKIRVAAYCRVSTDSSDQINSFFAQMKYYTDYIRNNNTMELVDIYADEGITGTAIEKRDEFKRLIKDCKNRKIDRVLVKSVTRFARNSLECIETVRELKGCGVTVYFENDNIDSESMNSEMILYIKGAFAQGEALSASKRMATSVRMKMENGTYYNTSVPFGYRLNGRNLIVNEEEAETVKKIYDMYLSGIGPQAIVKKLREEGWDVSVRLIYYILHNEKYIGDTLWQKSFTPDILPFRKKINHGELPKYYCENTHQAILPKENYYRAKRIQNERTDKYCKAGKAEKYFFSNKIYCEKCGWHYRRITKNDEILWMCAKKGRGNEVCRSHIFPESKIESAFVSVYNILKENTEYLLGETINALQAAKAKMNGEIEEIKEIDDALLSLGEKSSIYAKMYAESIISENIFIQKSDALKREISELRSRRAKLIESDEEEKSIESVRRLRKIIDDGPDKLIQIDKSLFSEITIKIIAGEDGTLHFIMLGGLDFAIKYEDII